MKRFLEHTERYGILSDPVKLSGLVVPGRESQGGTAERVSDSGMGYGTASRRFSGFLSEEDAARLKALRPQETIPGMGVPFPSEHSGRNCNAFRYVQF